MKYPGLERPHKDQVQLSVLDKTTLELNYVSVSTVQTLITEIQKEPWTIPHCLLIIFPYADYFCSVWIFVNFQFYWKSIMML